MSNSILEVIHETAQGLTKAGVMDVQTMREFDALCLPEVAHKGLAALAY
jgi:putative transcriptional regulator